jgi:putative transposase
LVFHVINRAAKRARLFAHPRDYAAFEHLLAEGIVDSQIALFAYCIMPNHWHLLLMPMTDAALSRFMHWLTTTHSRRWQLANGEAGSGAVYQGRFKSIPVGTDAHFLWVCRYVERNALRANLVDRAELWRWSSLWHREWLTGTAWLAAPPVSLPVNWTDHVNEPQTEAELTAFRSAVRTGEPFGSSEWREGIAREFHLRFRQQRGRHRREHRGSVL